VAKKSISWAALISARRSSYDSVMVVAAKVARSFAFMISELISQSGHLDGPSVRFFSPSRCSITKSYEEIITAHLHRCQDNTFDVWKYPRVFSSECIRTL
jgi:hypothetical protein